MLHIARSAPRHTAPAFRLLALACCAVLVLILGNAHPAPSASAPTGTEASGPANWQPFAEETLSGTWKLSADRIEGMHAEEIVEAHGNVILRNKDNYLRADFARFFRATGWIYLKGDIEARWKEDQMHAEEAEFDLRHQVGWLKQGQLFVTGPHIYFSGDYIRKHSGDTYSFRNARVTACDPGLKPGSEKETAWSFSAEQGDITLDGYARLWKADFRVKGQPVMFAPFLTVPARTSRHTGLLMPEMGVSGRLGVRYNQPFYWNIDQERDLTLYENFMSKRGLMQGLEFRHNTRYTKGWWRADWLYDAKTDGSESDEDGSFDDDGLVRTNRDRYWLRSKLDADLGNSGWKAKLDLDYVSDQNYLREFDQGISGYGDSLAALESAFGRDLAEDDENRVSTLLLSRSYERGGLALRTEYEQNVALGNGNAVYSTDDTLQRLPQLYGYWFKDSLGGTPLELEGEAEASYFWRRQGEHGARLDMAPRLSLPLTSRYGSIIPEVGYRQTFYATDWDGDAPSSIDDGEDDYTTAWRSLPHASVSASTEVNRVFYFEDEDEEDAKPAAVNPAAISARWTRMKHSVQPRIAFDYLPRRDQDTTPDYDDKDHLEATEELTYSLTNLLGRRREKWVAPASVPEAGWAEAEVEETAQTPVLDINYLDFARLLVEQSYDFREARRTDERDNYPRRPFGDVLVDLEITPEEYVTLFSRTWYSPYEDQVTEHEHGLSLTWPELFGPGGRVATTFALDFVEPMDEYKRQDVERIRQAKFGLSAILSPQWAVDLGYGVDWEDGEDKEKSLGITYSHQCYDIRLLLEQDEDDERVMLWFSLSGFDF